MKLYINSRTSIVLNDGEVTEWFSILLKITSTNSIHMLLLF